MRFARRGMRRGVSFGRRRSANEWLPVSGTAFSSITGSDTKVLLGFEAPTITLGTSLTADPPEDRTIKRIVAEFSVDLAAAATGTWTLGLIVADVNWSLTTGLFTGDADKRILWHQTYNASTAARYFWTLPNHLQVASSATGMIETDWRATHLDIKTSVKLEDGKALYAAAWEEANGQTLSWVIFNMRILMSRSRR